MSFRSTNHSSQKLQQHPKRAYTSSRPPAELWGIAEQGRYNTMVAQVASLAKQSRFLAMDSTQFFSFLRECRLDLWHVATNRQVDWGLLASWQHIFESMLVFARYTSVPPVLAVALGTMPLAPITHETAERDTVINLPVCRRLIEPAPVYTSWRVHAPELPCGHDAGREYLLRGP